MAGERGPFLGLGHPGQDGILGQAHPQGLGVQHLPQQAAQGVDVAGWAQQALPQVCPVRGCLGRHYQLGVQRDLEYAVQGPWSRGLACTMHLGTVTGCRAGALLSLLHAGPRSQTLLQSKHVSCSAQSCTLAVLLWGQDLGPVGPSA